jgi:hypothetical protein
MEEWVSEVPDQYSYTPLLQHSRIEGPLCVIAQMMESA